jgi:cell division protein FtsL
MKQDTEKMEALSASSFSPLAERSISSIPEPTVYGGTMMENMGKELPAPGNNRPAARRTRSTFNLMLFLIGSAVAIVLYISNVIKVSQLLAEINTLEGQHRRILMDQELLRAQINKMSSMERIRKLGEENLSLKNPTEPPVWIKVDEEKIRALEEAAQKRKPRK